MKLGIRPENLNLCRADTPNSIVTDIRVKEMMGSEMHIHCEYGDGKKVIVRAQIGDMSEDQQISLHKCKRISIQLRERNINLFDPEDGTNLAVENAVPVPKEEKKPEEDHKSAKKKAKKSK